MAIRFAGGDSYLADTGLPTTDTHTMTCWVRRETLSGGYHEAVSFGTQYTSIATNADGFTFGVWDSGAHNGAPFGATVLAADTWYFVGLVVDGAHVELHIAAEDDTDVTVTSADDLTSATPTLFRVGDYFGTGYGWAGDVADVKTWDARLDPTEVAAERAQFDPVRTADLLHYHPLHVAETADHSGNGYDLNASGTAPITVDDPPIPDSAGADHSRAVADPVDLLDLVAPQVAAARAVADQLGAVDAAAMGSVTARDVVDPLGTVDAAGTVAALDREPLDVLGVSDEASAAGDVAVDLVAAVGLADQHTRVQDHARSPLDLSGVLDVVGRAHHAEQALAERVGILDDIARQAGAWRDDLVELLGLLDVAAVPPPAAARGRLRTYDTAARLEVSTP